MATVLLDMGGGDQVFKRFAQSIELVTLLDQVGIMPVALHCIGPDIDDLSYLSGHRGKPGFLSDANHPRAE